MRTQTKTRYVLAGLMAMGLFTSSAFSQYSGPSTMGAASVADILANPVDDQGVRLQGHILRQQSSDKYIFSDGTGEILAKIKPKRFAGQSVDDKTKVEIYGEVDTSRKDPPKIEVDSIRIIE